MQNVSLKVCSRQSKRSQFTAILSVRSVQYISKWFLNRPNGVILLSSLTATPCVVFTKLCCLFLRPFALLASQLQSGRIFTIPVTFQWLKPDDINKKNKIHFSYYRHCFKYHCFSFHILLYQNNLKNTLFFLETWYLVIKISRSLNGRFFINTLS